MILQQFLQNLEQIGSNLDNNREIDKLRDDCSELHEVILDFINEANISFEDRIAGLQTLVHLFGNIRPQLSDNEKADDIGNSIFIACARLVLGVEFHRLQENEEPRASFNLAINNARSSLKELPIGDKFTVLQWLMVNYWSHATLVAMMKGDDMDEEQALNYIQSGEYPELIKLRVEMLVEGGCENYALNVCNWCVKCSRFEQDVFIRQTQLLLMHKFGHVTEFHNQCWQLQSQTAVQVVTHCLCYAGIHTKFQPCNKVSCIMARRVLNSLLEKEQRVSACLILAQTFLLQDWMNPSKNSCTEELLRLWLRVQRHVEDDSQLFLQSVEKVAAVAPHPSQNVLLVQVLYNEFGWEFLQFCCEQCLVALKRDRHKLDSARIMKDDKEADIAADGLAKTCRQIATLYEQHHQMWLGNLLTAFYLEPTKDIYFRLESKLRNRARETSSGEENRPSHVNENTYKEIWDMVEMLRPGSINAKLGWIELKKVLIFHLEEAGLKFNPNKNCFTDVQASGLPGPKCSKAVSRRPSASTGLKRSSSSEKKNVKYPVVVEQPSQLPNMSPKQLSQKKDTVLTQQSDNECYNTKTRISSKETCNSDKSHVNESQNLEIVQDQNSSIENSDVSCDLVSKESCAQNLSQSLFSEKQDQQSNLLASCVQNSNQNELTGNPTRDTADSKSVSHLNSSLEKQTLISSDSRDGTVQASQTTESLLPTANFVGANEKASLLKVENELVILNENLPDTFSKNQEITRITNSKEILGADVDSVESESVRTKMDGKVVITTSEIKSNYPNAVREKGRHCAESKQERSPTQENNSSEDNTEIPKTIDQEYGSDQVAEKAVHSVSIKTELAAQCGLINEPTKSAPDAISSTTSTKSEEKTGNENNVTANQRNFRCQFCKKWFPTMAQVQ